MWQLQQHYPYFWSAHAASEATLPLCIPILFLSFFFASSPSGVRVFLVSMWTHWMECWCDFQDQPLQLFYERSAFLSFGQFSSAQFWGWKSFVLQKIAKKMCFIKCRLIKKNFFPVNKLKTKKVMEKTMKRKSFNFIKKDNINRFLIVFNKTFKLCLTWSALLTVPHNIKGN